MIGQKRIDFTNLANKKSNDLFYAIVVIVIILICLIINIFIFGDKKEPSEKPIENPITTPSDNQENTPPVEDNTQNDNQTPPVVDDNQNNNQTPPVEEDNQNNNQPSEYESFTSIEKAKASTFIANVQVLYNNAQIEFFSQASNNNRIAEVSQRMNSVETTLRNYCVKLDTNGNILKIQAEDSLFYIELANLKSVTDIKVNDVKKGKLTTTDCIN